jgi:hypothetical protein
MLFYLASASYPLTSHWYPIPRWDDCNAVDLCIFHPSFLPFNRLYYQCTRSLDSFLLHDAMRCFPILGLTPSLDVFPSHWSHLCCAPTASISPPSLDGMDISHQRVPPHVAHCISHRNGSSALMRYSSCPLDCSSQLGPTPHAHDTIQAIQHIHTTLSAAPTRSRLCAAVHYGITSGINASWCTQRIQTTEGTDHK